MNIKSTPEVLYAIGSKSSNLDCKRMIREGCLIDLLSCATFDNKSLKIDEKHDKTLSD